MLLEATITTIAVGITFVSCCPWLKEMVDWFNGIRAARLHYLQVAFPGALDSEVSAERCTNNGTQQYLRTNSQLTDSNVPETRM